MKGNEAEYVIPLTDTIRQHTLKKARRAIVAVKRFVYKHARIKDVSISNEINEFVWSRSKNIPRKINAILLKDGEKVYVYLKGGKGLEEHKKKAAAEKKEKASKEKAKEAEKKAEEKKEKTAEEKQQEKLAEEKKAREKAAEKQH